MLFSQQNIVDKISQHILAFTQRLHSAELERRSLRQDLSRVKQEREEIEILLTTERETKENIQHVERGLCKKINSLEDQIEDMIHVERYQAVCDNLDMALKREEQAQGLLQEQTKQMKEMGKR